jgi:hypothetical protein
VGWELQEVRPSSGVRWVVGDRDGRRSSTFRFWSNPKGDFYLAGRSIGHLLKASLHRDGRCHVGYTKEHADSIGVSDRHLHRWTIPLDRLVKPIQIMVPEEDLVPFPASEKADTQWVPSAAPGSARFVGIIVVPTSNLASLGEPWPGSRRTKPIAVVTTQARTAFVLHWDNPVTPEQAESLRSLRRQMAAEAARRGLAPDADLRGVVFGDLGNASGNDVTLFDLTPWEHS